MTHQHIDSVEFRAVVLKALRQGRAKGSNVVICGEPDGGKSFVLKPFGRIFQAFVTRGQTENFPLQGLHGSEICLLQDVRFESFGLPWDDWLRWGEGEDMMVKLPRCTFEASRLYKGTAPLFATMADLFSYPLVEARMTGHLVERENRQWQSRWHIVTFRFDIPVGRRNSTIKPCAKYAAGWYLAAEPPGEDDWEDFDWAQLDEAMRGTKRAADSRGEDDWDDLDWAQLDEAMRGTEPPLNGSDVEEDWSDAYLAEALRATMG